VNEPRHALQRTLCFVGLLYLAWVLGFVAYKGKSVAASTLMHILNNLFSDS
jgi:membrane protease YdiL (CAAX protease family)